MRLGPVEAMQGGPAEGMGDEKDSIRAAAPEKAGYLSILVQIVIETVNEHHEEWIEGQNRRESRRKCPFTPYCEISVQSCSFRNCSRVRNRRKRARGN